MPFLAAGVNGPAPSGLLVLWLFDLQRGYQKRCLSRLIRSFLSPESRRCFLQAGTGASYPFEQIINWLGDRTPCSGEYER